MKTNKGISPTQAMGCGLLTEAQSKKLKKEQEKLQKLPTATADAMKIEELTAKLQASQAKVNELNGIIVVLRREFPGRTFDPYTPSAVLAICQEYKLAMAASVNKA